jgi:ubiquitin conjugation factor E4 B
LDEALTRFPTIHDLQLELGQPQGTLTPEERTTKEEELATAESQATSWMQFTNETIAMMSLFTKDLSPSFTMPEIVDRVAAMVNYTLNTLVGPKSKNLKVENTDKYHFNAKTLLGEFIEIYLNLGVEESFVSAVARDGRSYKPVNFDNATWIMNHRQLKAPEAVEAWKKLVARFIAAKEQEDQDEGDLGDIPDEFMDPIMADWMKDPVILPISRQTVDRSTIQGHLLSDPTDPFNRSPLKIEDVIENVELKER